ncbi:hypothetical protein RhiirB3_409485 [Rhizophagus irregularis]|nr:hypothetical protein RhiirB3_409485 [Rhizophagus irregularis]
MDGKLLIELLEGLTGPQNNDGQLQNALLERCIKASGSELKEFLDELSQLLCESPNIYLPVLQLFISHLRDESSRIIRRRNLQNTVLLDFFSMLITIVIMNNLHHSDILGFREILRECIELLWKCLDDKPSSSVSNKNNNQIKMTTKRLFSAILNAKGVLEVLLSESSGRYCLKRILFEFNMINEIEQNDLLNAVDMAASLLKKCSNHKNASSKLSDGVSIYKACASLLESLKNHQNTKNFERNSLPPNLLEMVELNYEKIGNRKRSVSNSDELKFLAKDEKYIILLGMETPRKLSDLPKFSRDLEKRKINSFKDWIGFWPCEYCHKLALINFSPEKYSHLMEEEKTADVENEFKQNFRLPFEFDDSDKLGPWDILLSEDTVKDMQRLESPLVTKAVMKVLGRISSGEWDKHKLQNKKSPHDIPVYEVELSDNKGLKIIWQIDYGFSIRSYSLTQLVKIWSITKDQNQIDKILVNLKSVHKVYAPENNYRYEIQKPCNGIILPKNFDDNEGTRSTNDGMSGTEMDNENLLEVHKMLVTNKFIPLSQNLFKSLILGGSGFTFNVSKIEYEIINNPTSAIIIGRSGTGKTTCIVFRLVASYLNNQLCKTPSSRKNNGNSYKRQIFITVSPNLCRRVKDYFKRLRESAEFAGKKMSMADFNEYVRKKEEEGGSNEETDDNDSYFEEGDEEEVGSFRELTDKDFPLFITYKQFTRMLLVTYGIDIQKQQKTIAEVDDVEDEEEEFSLNSLPNQPKNSWFHFVDYDLFYDKYWLHFSDYYRKKLDPGLVFSEFFVIKGTDPDVEYLSREDYRTISIRKFPVFRYNRDEIYDLFERYEKMKARNRDYDSVDLTLAILRAAKIKALGDPHIHEVYVDECQDNHIMDLALILKLFNRVDNVFMAGDIAQCIARGSSFRFQNLSTLIYKWELDRTNINHNQNNTVVPKQFELNINYRSHNGILQLASSVIDLIHHFFPDSIDHLSRERSEVGGPRPIVFKGFQAETFLFDVFSVDERMPNCSEFGAEQVIIVRNEEAKKSVGNVGIVMTVFEAKGMEFNDVLLYNFFTHSPARQKWRLILSALDNHSKGIQTFSHEKHYILSSELKHLYVAVTRARQHLWIFDEDSELSEPIRIFWGKDGWDKSGLIKVIQSLEELNSLPTLAKKSSSHDWNRKGKLFFERRQYELAKLCFSKSGNEMGFKLANAYNLQKIARSSLASNSYEANVKSNFISAAKAFETCSRPVQAASCYKDIGMNREAGDVYERWDMFEDAAYCYLEAKAFDKAGKCFEKAEKYTDAVVAYKDGSLYKEVVNLMQRHRERIDEKIFRRITRFVNIYYRRENNKVMSKEALSILSTHEEQIELLRDHAPEELLKVCEERGEFQDAAKELHLRGKFKEAADMFIRSNDEKDIIEALQCLLDLCKANILNIITDTMNQSILEELKSLCLKANEIVKLSKSSKRSDKLKILIGELQLYSAYLSDDLDRVRKCIQFFKENEKVDTEFHGINMWLKIVPQSYYESEYWHERLQYLIRLWELSIPYICAVTRPHNIRNISEIYNDFEKIFLVCNDKTRLNKRKILTEHPFRQCKSEMEDAVENIDNWHVYEIDDIHQTILKIFAPYIFELISDVNQKGREIREISSHICHKFTSCLRLNCQYYHVEPTPSVLHQRATLARLQYTVIRQLDMLYHRRLLKDEQSVEVRGIQRWWSENLIKVHFRYQSPQTSCSEVTYMMIDNLTYQACNGLNDLARKIWLSKLSKDPWDFAVMLKCMFVFQQLRNEWGIEDFSREMSKRITLSHPENIPVGFSYFYGYYQAIPVGKRLSLFFYFLYSNYIIKAITQLKLFIQCAINNYVLVNLNSTDAFGDLVSLMEFRVSLIFAIGPGYCDFCLPRSYLVNYFDVFTAEPLVLQTKYCYRRDNYCSEIRYSIEQIQKLLELLIREDERYYLTIILRLIRLLVLIGRNESSSSFKVISLFKSLIKNDLVHSGKVKKYLEESNIFRLVNILKDDLKETGCDSLVIVHYQWGGITRFQDLEKSGGVMLKYNSVESFHSSLWKIVSSVVTEKTSLANKLLSQRADVSVQNTDFIVGKEDDDNDNDDSEDDEDDEQRFTISREVSEVTTKIQVWFRQVQEDPRTLKAVKRIQYWFRMTNELRQTPNQLVRDKILDKIYNDTRNFCWNKSYWKDAINHQGAEIVRTYNMLLKGSTVDIVVELTKLQDKMDKIKNQLQKTISDRSIDDVKLESCLNLEDDLKHIHSENVKLALNSLLMTEDSTKHKEANIEWLKAELDQAEVIINQVLGWIEECKFTIKSK